MKIALVHEFLNQLGGAEQVLKNFLEIWPDATIHVILYNAEKTHGEFEKYQKKISILNRFPFAQTHPRLLLTLMPQAIEDFDFSDFDLVFSDSSSFAKGAKAKGKLHICYMHTPTRFLWTETNYIDYQRYPWVLKMLGKIFLPVLRKWDLRAALRPDFIIANSVNVQHRIKKYYNRESMVIPPPVDTDKFYPTDHKQDYFFTVSRLEPYKKIDEIIEAFNHLRLPLKIAGTGTIIDELKIKAKSNIEFLGRVSDEELRKHYAEARAFIFMAEEDAGIVLLEAQACGTPVLAYGKGGALESIVPGVTGEFFNQQNSESLVGALKSFDGAKYNSQKIRHHALQFSKLVFQKKIKQFVEEKYWQANNQPLPDYFKTELDKLGKNSQIKDLLPKIKVILDKIYNGPAIDPKSFEESRFISVQKAFELKYKSCGILVNIFGSTLRYLGFPVKYIHGRLSDQTSTNDRHSWLEVYENNSWTNIDPSESDFRLPDDAEKIKEYHDWLVLKKDYAKGEY